MAIRLIATDLDGPLLGEQDQISEYTRGVFRRAQQKGVRIVLVTGRSLRRCSAVRAALHTDDRPENYCIAFNGGLIHRCDGSADEYAPGIPTAAVERLLALTRRLDLQALCYGTPGCWTYARRGFARRRQVYLDQYGLPDEPLAENIPDDACELRDAHCPPELQSCTKITLLHSAHRLQHILPQVQAVCGPQAKAMIPTPGLLEILPAAVSKGAALRRVLRQCRIDPNDAAAFGNGENDGEMLRAVGHSYARRGALPLTPDEVAHTVQALCGL